MKVGLVAAFPSTFKAAAETLTFSEKVICTLPIPAVATEVTVGFTESASCLTTVVEIGFGVTRLPAKSLRPVKVECVILIFSHSSW